MLKFNHVYFEQDGLPHVVATCNSEEGSFKGEAVCKPSDIYDQAFGEKLAELKCLNKVRAARVRRLKRELNSATEAALFFSDLVRENSALLAKADAKYRNGLAEVEELIESTKA